MDVLKNKLVGMPICMVLVSSILCTAAKPVLAGVDVTIARALPAEELKLENLLLASVLASYFDVDLRIITMLRDKKHLTFSEAAMVLALAQASNRKVDTIASLRAKGHGWGVMAPKLGVHPGLFNHLRDYFHWGKSRDYVLEQIIMTKVLSAYFGIPATTIRRARAKGLSFEGIAVGLNVAAKSAKSVSEVFRLRTKGAGWGHVAEVLNLNQEELKRPPVAKQKFRALVENDETGKGKDRERGRGKN